MAPPYDLNRWYFGYHGNMPGNCNIFGQTVTVKFCTYSVRTKAYLTNFNGIQDFLQEWKLTRFNENVNFKEFRNCN